MDARAPTWGGGIRVMWISTSPCRTAAARSSASHYGTACPAVRSSWRSPTTRNYRALCDAKRELIRQLEHQKSARGPMKNRRLKSVDWASGHVHTAQGHRTRSIDPHQH